MPPPADTTPGSNRPTLSPVVRLLATGLYSGYSPIASGTAGSLVALAFFLLPGFGEPVILIPAIVVVFLVGVYVSAAAERTHGEDPGIVVIDEFVGMWVSALFLPVTPAALGTAFLFFRIFDILKPPPAKQAEALPHGWGIMADDIIAGVYANLAVRAVLLLLPSTILAPFS